MLYCALVLVSHCLRARTLPGQVSVEIPTLAPGQYLIIPSTFDEGYETMFNIRVYGPPACVVCVVFGITLYACV